MSDLWFVGDKFVNDNYHAMSAMLSVARINRSDPPYVFDYYNVKCYTSNPLSHVKSLSARIVNNVVKALLNKECTRLPRFIIVIPDWDILQYLNHNTYGVEQVAQQELEWIMEMMSNAVKSKKNELFKIKPGSAIGSELKIV